MNRVFVIAEAGVNHNGSPELAARLIETAAQAGADAVKFQAFTARHLVTAAAAKAPYQVHSTGEDGGQFAMLQALALDGTAFAALATHCRACGIEFLATPFDHPNLRLLVDDLHVTRLKLGSGDLTNAPLLHAAARTGKPLILSTGMATLGEVEHALAVVALGLLGDTPPTHAACRAALADPAAWDALRGRVTLLHCTTEYPAAPSKVNLRALDTLGAAFGLPVGLSDHTSGITAAVAAAARGAVVVEKHFTLDRALPGPDHRASLEPPELTALVRAVREVEQALGDGRKVPTPGESGNREPARRALVAAQPVRRGEPWSVTNLTAKRPARGLDPTWYWDLLGRPAGRDYAEDEAVDPWEAR